MAFFSCNVEAKDEITQKMFSEGPREISIEIHNKNKIFVLYSSTQNHTISHSHLPLIHVVGTVYVYNQEHISLVINRSISNLCRRGYKVCGWLLINVASVFHY